MKAQALALPMITKEQAESRISAMTRAEQCLHNQRIIATIRAVEKRSLHAPSYQAVVQMLNDRLLRTSTVNPWTRKALLRMLQRQGISGLHGLFH